MATVETYKRNTVEANDFPYHSLFASFDEEVYLAHDEWELENYFMETFRRDPIEVKAYVVENKLVIPANTLGPFDRYHLDRITDFDTYIMPNGSTAIEYYAPYVVNIDAYLDAIDNHNMNSFITRRKAGVEDEIETDVPQHFQASFIGVRFFDADGEVVVPTAGTVTVSVLTAVGGDYEEIATIDAMDPSGAIAYSNPLETVRVTPLGVTDAVDYQLTVWQA